MYYFACAQAGAEDGVLTRKPRSPTIFFTLFSIYLKNNIYTLLFYLY